MWCGVIFMNLLVYSLAQTGNEQLPQFLDIPIGQPQIMAYSDGRLMSLPTGAQANLPTGSIAATGATNPVLAPRMMVPAFSTYPNLMSELIRVWLRIADFWFQVSAKNQAGQNRQVPKLELSDYSWKTIFKTSCLVFLQLNVGCSRKFGPKLLRALNTEGYKRCR